MIPPCRSVCPAPDLLCFLPLYYTLLYDRLYIDIVIYACAGERPWADRTLTFKDNAGTGTKEKTLGINIFLRVFLMLR